MAFRVAARTILELGAELISSDGIALYELIKNGIDAGSRRVRIEVRVAMSRTAFDIANEEIDTSPGGLNEIRACVAGALDGDHKRKTELEERLASATTRGGLKQELAAWYTEANFIRVRDRGHGMSLAELGDVYLTVGTRSRLKTAESRDGKPPPLGGKGVGRLSTMRLGDHLTVVTTRAGERSASELVIDWTVFDHASDMMIDQIEIEPRAVGTKSDPERAGTDVVIGGLKSDWTAAKLEQIAGDEFARLVDPWEERAADDVLRLTYNGVPVDIPRIDPGLLERSHGYCSARLSLAGGEPALTGRVEYRYRGKERSFRLNATELVSATGIVSVPQLRSLGPFDLEMWWYNRGLITIKNGYPDASELRKEIAKWSGGLMLFRDGYRVNPYGGPEDDWLKLDQNAIKAGGYKLNRQQVVGRVRISWLNRGLLDQTNREGLVATPERATFLNLLRHILLTEFKGFIEAEDKQVRVSERTTLEAIGTRVETTETAIRGKLSEIEERLEPGQRAMAKQASRLLDELVGYVDDAKELGEQQADDRAQLVYLAGVGLMVEFILHELDRATTGTLRTLKGLDVRQLDAGSAAAVRTLTDQLDTLNKRVANLEGLGTVRRQSKTAFDVVELVNRALAAREGEAARHSITVGGDYAAYGPWPLRAVPGMLIQIVDNLLANSFYWLKKQSIVESGFAPRVTVERDGDLLLVTDNGPGVDPASADEVFQPFVTRKPVGEGRGLGLYISREVAANQGWGVDLLRAETARRGRFNTFVIDLAAKGKK